MNRTTYAYLLVLLSVLGHSFAGEVSESPYCSELRDWAPCAGVDFHHYNSLDGTVEHFNAVPSIAVDVIEARTCSSGKKQGYFLGSVYTGAQCTRNAFNQFAFQSGISCISSHGSYDRRTRPSGDTSPEEDLEDTIAVVYFSPHLDPLPRDGVTLAQRPALSDCIAWLGSDAVFNESEQRYQYRNGFSIISYTVVNEQGQRVGRKVAVLLKKKWFRDNWKGTHNAQRSIIVAFVCGSNPMIKAMGGRVGFGYDGVTLIAVAKANFGSIFDHMNGTNGEFAGGTPGNYRTAGKAFEAAAFTPPSTMTGNPLTTLCPSAVHPMVVNASGDPSSADPVYPLGQNAPTGDSIVGHVTFDTRMDRALPANEVLTFNVISGNIEIDTQKIKWVSDHEIQFEYKASDYGYSSNGNGAFEVEMRVIATKARAANSNYPVGSGNKFLDGGDVGSSRSGIHGVANNGDDYVWRFSKQ